MNAQPTPKSRRSGPNWKIENVHMDGDLKEVIVIEDTPTPSPPPPRQLQQQSSGPDPAASTSSRPKRQRDDGKTDNDAVPTGAETDPKRRRKASISSQAASSVTMTSRQLPRQAIPPTTGRGIRSFIPPLQRAAQPACDDKDGHYIIKSNEFITERYQIRRLLGQGTFGKVVECYDRVRRRLCAIKIIRAVQKYRDASKIEIRVLNTLKEHDPLNLNKCIHLLEWFDYRNHICMVFELLGQSVFDFLKANNYKPFPPNHIQQFAKQLLTSVAFVHDLKLIHTDLKPENILLVNNDSSEKTVVTSAGASNRRGETTRILDCTDIRLIDFGSATFEQDHHSSVVSTRHYRAPEIILGLGWSYPCDIWSIGCMLVEFCTGDALFQTHDNIEHLAMMQVVLGKIPQNIIERISENARTFFSNGRLNYPSKNTTPQGRQYVQALKPLKEIIPSSSSMRGLFLDLLSRMLVYNPAQRITAREALRHPFFHLEFDEHGRIPGER